LGNESTTVEGWTVRHLVTRPHGASATPNTVERALREAFDETCAENRNQPLIDLLDEALQEIARFKRVEEEALQQIARFKQLGAAPS
jgi:primosomal protein N''